MNIDNSVLSVNTANNQQSAGDIKSLDEIASQEENQPNFGFMMMYEEWKQNILLSNGLNDDENSDW